MLDYIYKPLKYRHNYRSCVARVKRSSATFIRYYIHIPYIDISPPFEHSSAAMAICSTNRAPLLLPLKFSGSDSYLNTSNLFTDLYVFDSITQRNDDHYPLYCSLRDLKLSLILIAKDHIRTMAVFIY